MRKRNKLLDRKFHLAYLDPNYVDETKLRETLHEMEEMVKRKLFTEQEMKCNNDIFSVLKSFFRLLIVLFHCSATAAGKI